MNSIRIKAPAKINIGLNIVRKRDDGFHDLETFFYPIHDLYDELTFEQSPSFYFECSDEQLLKSNLVIRAKELLENETLKSFPVKITLEKNIPSGAGLGGGSSDAAATLICLNEMYSLGVSKERLNELALQLGSDVPFFIKSKPAVGKSRGEILSLTDFSVPYHILIVNPGIHVSTKEAFAKISPSPSNILYEDVFTSFDSFKLHKDDITNDFEEYVFSKHPEIKSIKKIMIDNNAEFSLMSGSGSTVYGFFSDIDNLEFTSKSLPNHYLKIISSPD